MTQRDPRARRKIKSSSDEAHVYAAEVPELMDIESGHLHQPGWHLARRPDLGLFHDLATPGPELSRCARQLTLQHATRRGPPHSLVLYP